MASDADRQTLTPEEGLLAIHATMESARNSMYLAGTATILLLWGVIVSLGYLAEYALDTAVADFAEGRPWLSAPLWGVLVAVGMAGSAVIGHRAGRDLATGEAVRGAGIRVFAFWLAVAAAAFLVPAAAGLWTEEQTEAVPRVAIGIVALGHILFGIMHRPVIAAFGVGIAAAFYVPSYLAGDAALAVSAAATLVVVAVATAWIRRTGVL